MHAPRQNIPSAPLLTRRPRPPRFRPTFRSTAPSLARRHKIPSTSLIAFPSVCSLCQIGMFWQIWGPPLPLLAMSQDLRLRFQRAFAHSVRFTPSFATLERVLPCPDPNFRGRNLPWPSQGMLPCPVLTQCFRGLSLRRKIYASADTSRDIG